MNFDEDAILYLILLFTWVEYLWEQYLSLRQVRGSLIKVTKIEFIEKKPYFIIC